MRAEGGRAGGMEAAFAPYRPVQSRDNTPQAYMGVQRGSHGTARGVRLTLYVAGSSPRSQRAICNLYGMMARPEAGACEVEVVDVLDAPERAEEDRVLATPTLLKESPPPRRRVTGDLSDAAIVMRIIFTPDPPRAALPLSSWFTSRREGKA